MCLSFCSCAPRLALEKTSFDELNGWYGDHTQALVAFDKSCKKIQSLPENHDMGIAGTPKDWVRTCYESEVYLNEKSLGDKRARIFFEDNFVPFKAYKKPFYTNLFNKSDGLFTGYYEPALNGSRTKSDKYKYPLYKKPQDLKDGEPYLGRRRIDNGELDGKGLELVYVDDPVKLFFLQIQGSGRVFLEDGSVMRVGYDGKNNCPYKSIGKYLIDEGIMTKEQVTADSIKEWLWNNPDKAQQVMQVNQSYVFFREIKGDGPIGSQGVALTPEASLAVDKKFIKLGLPVWLETTMPDFGEGEEKYNRLLIAQDTGGVIKGPVRGDVFFGYGEAAEKKASYMKQKGEYSVLIPRELAKKIEEENAWWKW